jgi:hypothetical protein
VQALIHSVLYLLLSLFVYLYRPKVFWNDLAAKWLDLVYCLAKVVTKDWPSILHRLCSKSGP